MYGRLGLAAGLAVVLGASWWLAILALAAALVVLRRPACPDRAVAGWALLALGAVAAKQAVAARALPGAVGRLPEASLTLVTAVAALGLAAGAAEATRPRRWLAAGLGLTGAVTLSQLGWVWTAPPGALRLERAERAGAEWLVYESVLDRARGGACGAPCPGDDVLLARLVRAVPLRDEAALALGWRAALDLGWRPRRAEGVAVPVARELEARGRGGEAFRLLSMHPREGEVDGFMSMMERVEGAPLHWRGGVLGEAVPGRLALDAELAHNGTFTLEFTATESVRGGRLLLEGTAYLGAPRVSVQLDAAPAREVVVGGALALELGPLEAGPHRLRVRFDDDLVGESGDRNVVVRALDAPQSP